MLKLKLLPTRRHNTEDLGWHLSTKLYDKYFFLQITSNIVCNLLKESVCKEYNVNSHDKTHTTKNITFIEICQNDKLC